MPRSPKPSQPPAHSERAGTLLESPEDIRRALQAKKTAQQPALVPPAPVSAPAVADAPAQPARSPAMPPAHPYRPSFRPPVALLTVCDDGEKDGEVVRIRSDRFIIGRTEGDFLIPHDGLISGRHVEITRQRVADGYRWVVTDLQTKNGLFVRVSRTALADKAEFMVGRGRYRLEGPGAAPPSTVENPLPEPSSEFTRPWGAEFAFPRPPVLAELLSGETVVRMPLVAAEYWIGRDPACAICRADDPFTEPQQVRLYREANGVWHAQNNKSLNGLWLKVAQITVDEGCLFQIGEQRCRLTVSG